MSKAQKEKPKPRPSLSKVPRSSLSSVRSLSASSVSRQKSSVSISESKSESLAIPQETARVTRQTSQKVVTESDMALKDFIAVSDRLSQFEARFAGSEGASLFTLQVRRDQIRSIWEKVELAFEHGSQGAGSSGDFEIMQAKYEHCYSVYERCVAQLSESIDAASTKKQAQPMVQSVSRGYSLPPIDTEVFDGDYLRWPTFRDLFTAIYIDNPRLTQVEKLFHLNAKTSGEAKGIVSKSPLTHDGFQSAWQNLSERFENKRLLVNSQLKILFNLPSVSQESGNALKELQSTIQGCLTAFKLAKVSIENWDCLLVFLCSSRLPKLTLSLWEQSLHNKSDIPTWVEFDSFLSERHRTLEAIEDIRPNTGVQAQFHRKEAAQKKINSFEAKVKVNAQPSKQTLTCKLCSKENHPIRSCPKFLQMAVNDRASYIRQLQLCLNCFARGHQLKDCTSSFNCYTCKGRHNTLLHRGDPPSQVVSGASLSSAATPYIPTTDIQSTSNQSPANIHNYFTSNTQGVLLGTAIINICHLGTCYKARALIDSGSEATFISERMFRIIKLPYKRVTAQVAGLNQAVAANPEKLCHFNIGSPTRPRVRIEASAFVLPSVAGTLPSHPIPESSVRDLPNIPLADPSFYRSSQIDVLLGADILPSILLGGSIPNICGALLGQETIFGYILTGPITTCAASSISAFSTRVTVKADQRLENLLTKFWEVEDLPVKPVKESDAICEDNFIRTTSRDKSGKYSVTLPFKHPDHINLGHSRSIALAQFLKNEIRLNRNFPLKEQYDSVIQEYLDLGHMRQVPPSSSTLNFYLPHHAVFKPDSTTTKVRVVFNASSQSTNGKSLNDVLHTGPVLQSDLTIQILKWRFFRYGFNADITKMYRQILVRPDHTPFQRILYRNKDQELCDYELNTVTFGVNCAPFLAIRVLQQLAQDVLAQFPRASDIISNYMYVDDVLAGAHTKQCAIASIKELQGAMDSAGFPLRKWTSNEKEVLRGIPKDHLLREDFLEFEEASVAKTLGIRWQADTDEFFFAPSDIPIKETVTKREVLSEIAKLFDPAGWLAPVIVRAKIFMQEIWLHELGWDDPMPSQLVQRWEDFTANHPRLGDIRVPRWISFQPKASIQIHGFCDASQKAYGAALYVRVEVGCEVSVHLLTSKTRVAPVKTVSLPRLELCGAVLLAELSLAIIPQMPIAKPETFYWTDSTIVLAWLRRSPCSWTTFVANRISKIGQLTDCQAWSHVRSEDNPADLASRGVSPQELKDSHLWWNGPDWLRLPREQWPILSDSNLETELEQRPVKAHIAELVPSFDPLERFSNFGRALRVTAYVFRFAKRCRQSSLLFPTHQLQNSELLEAQERLVLITQRNSFPKEYDCLRDKRSLPASSNILKFNPFLDPKGIMRASGRICKSSNLNYDERHPVILPYSCSFSRLLVKFTHQISLHGGNQLMMRLIRSRFWIPKLKTLITSVTNSCRACVVFKKKLQTQLMGSLPEERSTFSRPFTHTGIDFAGPFEIKNYTGRACLITKGYVCVFVCFSTKAIHLEATSDLTTDKFLAAFARFIARRGCPSKVYSDNGKTFVGASRVITRDFLAATKARVETSYSHHCLSWHFNPPSAPHMGGLWEAGVKSFKALFYKSTATFKYTFEELSTLLSKIEACLNSRPISPLSEDVTDLLALTPGHFLVGGPLLAVSEPEIEGDAASILNRWQRLKALNQHFCFRWKEEYLKELHKRTKWQLPERNLQQGDMVVVKEDNLPSNEWRLGRVQETHAGQDDRVRVVDVLTTRGIIKRPVAKLILLPIHPEPKPPMS